MAGAIGSLQLNHNLNYVFASFDPTSLVFSQFSSDNHHQSHARRLTTQTFFMERGPRYEEYAALRESKLRMKNMKQKESLSTQEKEEEKRKQVKSGGNLITQQKKTKGPSFVLTHSVPEYAPALKKENRRPAPAMMEKSVTPALRSKSGTYDGILGKMVGSKSVNAVEKKSGSGGFMGRKSYASLEVLKGLGTQARRAINGESKGMRTPRSFHLDRTEFAYSSQF